MRSSPRSRRAPRPGPQLAARRSPRQRDAELAALVRAAQAGDNRAWSALVRRFEPPLRRIARSYRLTEPDVDEALQSTWLRLLGGIGQLTNPLAIGAWLATTTRRECLRILQAPVREQLTADPLLGDGSDDRRPEAGLLAGERRAALAQAFKTLPERHRRLMLLLALRPAVSYSAISDALGIPVGSIGPLRQRCLIRLARDEGLLALYEEDD